MKKLFLMMVFMISFINAKTILVDKNLIWMPIIGYMGGCDNADEKYKTIQDALDSANTTTDDVTIKICPGEYEESNLKIERNNLSIISTQADNIDDVIISDNSNNPIFDIKGWREGIKFDFFSIEQNKNNKIAIKIEKGKDLLFSNLKITSKGVGIIQNGGSFQNSTFLNLSINTKKQGIIFDNPQNIILKDMDVTSSKNIALDFGSPKGKITIQKETKRNYFNAKNIAIDIGDSSQEYIIKDSDIISNNNDGINGDLANRLSIENCTIKSKHKNIYIKNANKVNLIDSILKNGEYGVYIENSSNKGEIKNNIFKNNDLGLKLLNNSARRGYIIENNCFENSENILNNDKNAIFDKNYWNDWDGSGSYTIQYYGEDNHPLNQCNLEDNFNNATLFLNYRMDECRWNGNLNEVKDSSENHFDATAKNGANTETNQTIGGMIGRVGDFVNGNHAIFKNITLPHEYTITMWVKFPLNDINHKSFSGQKYYNIADRPDSKKDYIYFSEGSRWNLCIFGDDYECKRFNPQALNGWHFVAFKVSNSDTKFYIDDTLKLTFTKQHPNGGELGLFFNSDYKSSQNNPNAQSIGAYVDEFKIFNNILDDNDLNNIYHNELSRKNYDGSIREEINCNNNEEANSSLFYIIEQGRDDRNITTQKVKEDINITIMSNNSFKGTICSAVVDENENVISQWHNNYLNNQTFVNEVFNVDKAYKKVYIKAEWKAHTHTRHCPLGHEDNHTLSDVFAIRPIKFDIDTNSIIYALDEFNITYKALDNDNNAVNNYNENNSFFINVKENKNWCHLGNFESNISFNNGVSNSIATYDETGDINITIYETRNNCFASVDAINDATSDEKLLITPKTINLKSYPYKISTITTFDKNIVYDDINLSNYAKIMTLIQAEDKNGSVLINFDKNCYSQDVKLYFDTTNNIVDAFKGMINLNGIEFNDSKFETFDKNFSISKDLFENGKMINNIKFNIYKNRAYPISIVDLNFSKVVSYIPLAKETENNEILNHIFSFYYLKVFGDDIYTQEINSSENIYIIVYDRNRNHFDDEKLLNWFVDTNFDKDEVSILGYTTSYKYDNNVSDFDVNLTKNSYYYNLAVSNHKNHFVIIHLKTPLYMWYSRYKDYNDSLNSDCVEHYCIEYIYENNQENENNDVGSGEFEGSEINVTPSKRMGIKIYR